MRGWEHLPDGKINHVIDFIPPDEAPEGEALELDNKHVWQTPQQQLLGGFSVLLAFWTVPSNQSNSSAHTSLHTSIHTSFLMSGGAELDVFNKNPGLKVSLDSQLQPAL